MHESAASSSAGLARECRAPAPLRSLLAPNQPPPARPPGSRLGASGKAVGCSHRSPRDPRNALRSRSRLSVALRRPAVGPSSGPYRPKLSFRRRPNLNRFIITKSRDNATTLSCIRRLRVELLGAEKRDLDLIEVLDGPDGLESCLFNRRNILAEAEGKPGATAESIVAALLEELHKIRASGQSTHQPSGGDAPAAPLAESRLVAVLTGSDNAPFRAITTAPSS